MEGDWNVKNSEAQRFKALILGRLSEIISEEELSRQGLDIVALDQQAIGRLSRMDALQNQAMAKSMKVRRDNEKSALSQALVRLENGEYGYCEDCGDQIPAKRLELRLTTSKCVSCAGS